MGHVDHGKTSLLDAIRNSKIAAGEAGGITQAIGAYHVDVKSGDGPERQIVFIDTPGHEAFTKMRARGAKVTDIVILVVAADDGVMPQTIEAINHTKAADVPMVVAINKIDKPGANPDKVEQMLLQYGVQTEAYGGEVPCVRVSAKTKEGLDLLLETVLLVADLKDLKAVYECAAAGSILEARLDRGRGPVATVLVQQGTLHAGEIFVAGATMGRVRAMFNDRGEKITEATPSMAVQILGFEEVPVSGDNLQVVEDESKARNIVGFRQEKAKAAAQIKQRVTLENLFSTLKEGQIKELPLIIKADTQGSVESLVGSLERLSTEKVRVRIIHAAAGTVTENDVLLAEASKATIIAFSSKAERKAEELAQEEGVDIRFHDIIYKVTEEIAAAMMGLLDAIEKETIQGLAEVRQLFKVNKSVIAGSFVTEGKVQKGYRARVKRGAGRGLGGRHPDPQAVQGRRPRGEERPGLRHRPGRLHRPAGRRPPGVLHPGEDRGHQSELDELFLVGRPGVNRRAFCSYPPGKVQSCPILQNRASRQRGFTLLELLTVMTILALLATVGIVGYRRHTKAAREAVLKEDLFQLNHCLEQFQADRASTPPPSASCANRNTSATSRWTP